MAFQKHNKLKRMSVMYNMYTWMHQKHSIIPKPIMMSWILFIVFLMFRTTHALTDDSHLKIRHMNGNNLNRLNRVPHKHKPFSKNNDTSSSSSIAFLSSKSSTVSNRCLINASKPEEPKLFYYHDTELPIGILISDRLTHRLASNVLKVFAEEILGYVNVSLVSMVDPSQGFDPDTQFSYVSSCTDPNCLNLDKVDILPAPRAMINLETWLPSNYQIEERGWNVKDIGPLGPGGRFGWYIPSEFASTIQPIRDHWRAFVGDVAKDFAPSQVDLQFIKEQTIRDNGSKVCTPPMCNEEGIYVSDYCQKNGFNECALMITGFPVVQKSFNMTGLLIKQIESLGMRVNIAFVGDKLMKTVNYLENQSSSIRSGANSYLLFHYNPSRITSLYHYTPIKFEFCDHTEHHHSMQPSLYQNTSFFNANCLYNNNKFAKVIWDPMKDRAQFLYQTLEKVTFSTNNYHELLDLYNEKVNKYLQNRVLDHISKEQEKKIIHEVSCQWLNKEDESYRNQHNKTIRNYQKWDFLGSDKQELNIAGIFPMSGNIYVARELVPVALLAVDHINNNDTLLRNYDLNLHLVDGRCKEATVMQRFLDVYTNKKHKTYVGVLGPACSDTIEPIAGLSTHFKTPVITYSAEGGASTDDESAKEGHKFPYLFRTIAENKQYKSVYLEFFKKIGWTKVASLTQEGDQYSGYVSELQDYLQTHGIDFVINRKFQESAINTPEADMSMYLNNLKERHVRIIIGEFFVHAARNIICEAYKQKMTQKQGYVWFLPGWYADDWYDLDMLRQDDTNNLTYNGDGTNIEESTLNMDTFLPNCTTAEMVEALSGHFSLNKAHYAEDREIMQTGRTVSEWRREVKNRLDRHNFDGDHPNKYSGYVYDAVWLYAQSLDHLIKQNQSYIQDIHSSRSIKKYVEIITGMDFYGASGRISFPNNGHARLSNIKIVQWYQNDSRVIGVYKPNYEDVEFVRKEGRLTDWKREDIRWKTPDGKQPKDFVNDRKCSILSKFATVLNLNCEEAITVAFVIGFGALFILLLIVFMVFKRRYEQKMKQTEDRMRALGLLTPSCVLTLDEWEIPRDRVVINRKLGEGAFGTVYGGEAFFDEKGWSKLERLWSLPSFKDIAMRTDLLDSNYFHLDGVLRVAVAVKTLKTGSSVEEKLDFLGEADMMKRFDHKNIVKLLGVCTRIEPVYTVMEFMLYGDLKTYLLARRHLVNERNREELDEVSNRRLTSMALDVARGLSYLAELKYVHRDVACRNCLVNSSRVVKLADFGMTRPMYENDYYRFSRKGMLPVRWMAPESLADGLFTPMSDVWSYGVLLYEMITFGSFPFQGLSNNQVLEHVKDGHTLSIPSGIKSQLETLLKSCWQMTATKRPTASEVVELLSNTPRLICPCIDIPLASVQVERTDSLELIPSVRKPSGSVSRTNKPILNSSSTKRIKDYSTSSGYQSGNNGTSESSLPRENGQLKSTNGAYSPMSGLINNYHSQCNGKSRSDSPNQHIRIDFSDSSRHPLLSSSNYERGSPPPIPLEEVRSWQRQSLKNQAESNNSSNNASYVPPGYIIVDHTTSRGTIKPKISSNFDGDYVPSSNASM